MDPNASVTNLLAAQERDVEQARTRVISLAVERRKREAKLARLLAADLDERLSA